MTGKQWAGVACTACALSWQINMADAQTLDFMSGTPAPDPVVTGAPYAADGITTVKLTLFDGTRIERRVTARFYRDSAGRIRREQTVVGLEALNPASQPVKVVTIIDPVAGVIYSLNPGDHRAYRLPIPRPASEGQPPPPPAAPPAPAGLTPGGPPPPPPAPVRGQEESLGTRQIEGLTATGKRTTSTIPAGQIGNDRPIQVIDERWESPELRLLILSRHHDPRTGDIEYRLINIDRGEPKPDLFTVPADYAIVDAPPPPRRKNM
jgi:hypothetical protein